MKDDNVTELRRNLSAYLDNLRRGQRIKVTLSGEVVAEIVPPAGDKYQVAAARGRLRGSVIGYD